MYAWVITKDHLVEDCEGHESTNGPIGNVEYCDGSCARTDVGTTGPRDAPEALLALLRKGKGDTFRMYDGDEELYYTGRLVVDGTATTHEDQEACFGPLDDFGTGNAGCTSIRWPGHPERNNG